MKNLVRVKKMHAIDDKFPNINMYKILFLQVVSISDILNINVNMNKLNYNPKTIASDFILY